MKKTLLTFITLLFIVHSFSQGIVYVDIDATGTNNGTNWVNAYNDPKDAFDNASIGDKIWIAEGTYVCQDTARTATFIWLVDSISVYGGFNGTETVLTQRDWRNNPTIFSGEIQGDNDLTNNSFTVLSGPDGTTGLPINYSLIDGITISDGYATTVNAAGTQLYRWGGGFFLSGNVRKIDMNNCSYLNNHALAGGAMNVSPSGVAAELNITNTRFEGNVASTASVIWVAARQYKKPTITIENSLFIKNINKDLGANTSGGVFYFSTNYSHSTVHINNNTITENADSNSSSTRSVFLLFRFSSASMTDLTVKNSIIYYNPYFIATVSNFSSSNFFFAADFYNCISNLNSYTVTTTLDKVYTHNPLFVNIATGDYTLQSTSPAIDSGTQVGLTVPLYDFGGKQRIYGSQIDLDCYEYFQTFASISENVNDLEVSVYPNPTSNLLNFTSNHEIDLIEIYDLSGKRINSFVNTKSIDISNYNSGVYIVKIFSDENVATKKVIRN